MEQVVFGGVGVGLIGMLMYAILAIFLGARRWAHARVSGQETGSERDDHGGDCRDCACDCDAHICGDRSDHPRRPQQLE